ncbi:MAG: hypothetical protein LBP37_04000 [Spirochaetaceae bacterium]|jgi:hypothetical protein|nr:hypothetical protein [Spirochaetaceae bacterium]
MPGNKKHHILRNILLIIGGLFVALALIAIFAPEPTAKPVEAPVIPTEGPKENIAPALEKYNLVFSDENGTIAAEGLIEEGNLVIHNISGKNLSNLYIIIQTLKGKEYADQYVDNRGETLANNEIIKIDKWVRIGDGPPVENENLPGLGYTIKSIYFDCDEGTFHAYSKTAEQEQAAPAVLEEWQKTNNRFAAYVMMQEYVKQQLKAPSTAKFGRTIDTGVSVTQGENYIYTIKSYVDAQNEFGAMLRIYFGGGIKQIGKDEWLPLSLEFGE